MTRIAASFTALPLLALGFLCGCHSYQIDATVENRTGTAIELLEVDYPSASFGADNLAVGADFHYRFKVRGSGPVKVQYTEGGNHRVRQMNGPEVFERQEGRLEIELLPDGKAEFHAELSPHL
ncbi:MAG: hypothetical protein ACLPH3_13840 [Terracidiphilus sp.]